MSYDLHKIADVLEKAAEYIDEIESRKIAEERTVRTKTATHLAEQLSNLTGEKFDPEKLANLDNDLTDMLKKIASSEGVESLGGPRQNEGTEKRASTGSSIDDRFAAFCIS